MPSCPAARDRPDATAITGANLNPWPEKPAAKTTLREFRMMIHDEVIIGCHGVQAGRRMPQAGTSLLIVAGEPGHVFRSDGGEWVQVSGSRRRNRAVGIGQVAPADVLGHLDAQAGHAGKSVGEILRETRRRACDPAANSSGVRGSNQASTLRFTAGVGVEGCATAHPPRRRR